MTLEEVDDLEGIFEGYFERVRSLVQSTYRGLPRYQICAIWLLAR